MVCHYLLNFSSYPARNDVVTLALFHKGATTTVRQIATLSLALLAALVDVEIATMAK